MASIKSYQYPCLFVTILWAADEFSVYFCCIFYTSVSRPQKIFVTSQWRDLSFGVLHCSSIFPGNILELFTRSWKAETFRYEWILQCSKEADAKNWTWADAIIQRMFPFANLSCFMRGSMGGWAGFSVCVGSKCYSQKHRQLQRMRGWRAVTGRIFCKRWKNRNTLSPCSHRVCESTAERCFNNCLWNASIMRYLQNHHVHTAGSDGKIYWTQLNAFFLFHIKSLLRSL